MPSCNRSAQGPALQCDTEHPTAAWTSQQIREACADREPSQYVIRDRDGVYGNIVRQCIASLGMEEVLTAPHSPGKIRTSRAWSARSGESA